MEDYQDYPLEEERPIVRIVHALLQTAIREGVTELRFIPGIYQTGAWSPLRIQSLAEGQWRDFPPTPQMPGVIYNTIMRRFKIMADVNPFSRKGPQEGIIRTSISDSDDEKQKRHYQIHASFQEGPEGITTELSIREAGP